MSCATPSRASNPTLDDVKSRIPSRGAIRSTLVRPAGSAAFAGTVSMPRVSSDVAPRRCSVPRAPGGRSWPPESNRRGSSEGLFFWLYVARLNDAVKRDQRSEHGYLEHESTPVVLGAEHFNGRLRSSRTDRGDPSASTTSSRVSRNTMGTERRLPRGRRGGHRGARLLHLDMAAAAAMCGLDGNLDLTQRGGRVVCVGLGTGALPAFIARKFPAAVVEVCEIDPVVVEAVRDFHGLPKLPKLPGPWGDKPVPGNLPPGVGVCMGDAGEFMERAARAVERGRPTASVVFRRLRRRRRGSVAPVLARLFRQVRPGPGARRVLDRQSVQRSRGFEAASTDRGRRAEPRSSCRGGDNLSG